MSVGGPEPTGTGASAGARTRRVPAGWWRLRPALKFLALRALLPAAALLGRRAGSAFGILMYHRVAEHSRGLPRPTHNVTPGRLRQQLGGLAARGYRAWPLAGVIDAAARGRRIPGRVFVVTFDDGYETFYRNAWPILGDLGVPATLFLPTAHIGSGRALPFDDWPWAGSPEVPSPSWRPLSWAQCRDISRDPLVEIGAHTHAHPAFYDRPEKLAGDLAACMGVLRAHFGERPFSFALPFGTGCLGFSLERMAAAARGAGATCALTTEPVVADPAKSPYGWGRFEIGQEDTAATIALRLDGWYKPILRAGRALYRLAGRPRR